MKTDKPREFWIYPTDLGTEKEKINVERYETLPPFLSEITVGIRAIEYTAVEQLEQRVKEQEQHFSKAFNNWQEAAWELGQTKVKLAAQEAVIKLLKESNDFYADDANWEDPSTVKDPDWKANEIKKQLEQLTKASK
jgi:hypothetical protein